MLMCPSAFLFSLKFSVESQSNEKNDTGIKSEEIPKWPGRHQCGDRCCKQEGLSYGLGNACQT